MPVAAGKHQVAVLLAAAPPAALVIGAARRAHARWRVPTSPAALGLIGMHVLSGAVIEEVLWRGFLTRPHRCRGLLAVGSAVGFAAAHLPRDGVRSAGVHAINSAAWTASVLFSARLRWSVLAHAAYNVAAYSLVTPTGAPV